LKSALSRPAGGWHVDEASTLLSATEVLCRNAGYTLILYDWHLPDGGGCKGLVAICQLAPGVPVVVITADDDDAVRVAALSIGAADCLSKSIGADRLREVLSQWVGPESSHAEPVDRKVPPALTPRQLDVLRLMARGDPNKCIAQRLGIAETTVRAHVSDILGLLQARNRTEAVMRAARMGLFDD
jgi:two-component system, NarL family, nitrate/nitrite response regulator NarL